jgi:uncharacterized protein (TIGR02246 family)
MRKLLHLSTVVALIGLSAATGAAADDAKLLREANDRAEIQALMWRYVRALDTLDADAYASVFTENAKFGTTEGREALRSMILGMKDSRAKNRAASGAPPLVTYQTMSNINIEFVSESRARLQAYYMAVIAGAAAGDPPRVATIGREINDLVKVDGQWLIENRNVTPQD